MIEGIDGMSHDVSTGAGESTDLIIMEDVSTVACEPDPPPSVEPLRFTPLMNGHCDSPSISLSNFSNRGRNRHTSKFSSCDSNSCCLSCMSVIFVAVGAFITITTFGGTKFSLGHMWSVGPIFFCVGIMMAMKCYVYLRSKREIEMLFIAEIVCQQMMRLEDEGRRRLFERSQQFFNSHGVSREIFTLITEQVLPDQMLRCRDHESQTEDVWDEVISRTPSPQHHGELPLYEIVQETPPLNRSSVSASPNSIRNQPPTYESVTKSDVEASPPTYNEAIALMSQHKDTPQGTE